MKALGGLLAALVLAGCVNGVGAGNDRPSGVVVTSGGLVPVGSILRIDFGRAQLGVIEAVSKLQGAQPEQVSTIEECGAGPVTAARWTNGMTLNFQNEVFLGWTVQAPFAGTSSSDGLRIGTTIADLGVPLEQTSLGREFLKDDIWGLIHEDETQVGLLWSGLTCFFR